MAIAPKAPALERRGRSPAVGRAQVSGKHIYWRMGHRKAANEPLGFAEAWVSRMKLTGSLVAWFGVWAFWFLTTRKFHPTAALAFTVTTALVAAYATAAYLNHLVLLPRMWEVGKRWRYLATLVAVIVTLTAAALTVIRLCYLEWWGPDPDPNGAYKHFAIDLVGMVVHLVLAAVVVTVARKLAARGALKAPAERLSSQRGQ